MADNFYRDVLPAETTFVLGLKLRPLSLGHVILLHRVESAFVVGGIPDFTDLALTALLCASTYREGCSYLTQDLSETMEAWARKLTGLDRRLVRWGFRKVTPIDLVKECKTISDYIAKASKIPNYSFNPGDFVEMDCPQVQLVKVTLMRDLKFTEDELMDRSWIHCLWDYVTLKALAGQVKLISEDSIQDAISAARAVQEAIAAGRIKPCQS